MSRRSTEIVIAGVLLAGGCSPSAAREYELRGKVLAVDPARQEITIKHEDIPQFMPGMTMAFKVADKELLNGRVAGDLVKATLIVRNSDAQLRTLERTGFAPVSATEPLPMPVLRAGEQISDATFVDETGAVRRLADWRGKVLVVTFIYTRCPLSNFCPLMDRHFKTTQDTIRSETALSSRVRLLSVSLDPRYDTPPVLARHAAELLADPEVWSFLTGQANEIATFAKQFGVSIMRGSESDQDIVHNLRTAIIDADGRLTTVLNGSEWTPLELLAAVRKGLHGQGSR